MRERLASTSRNACRKPRRSRITSTVGAAAAAMSRRSSRRAAGVDQSDLLVTKANGDPDRRLLDRRTSKVDDARPICSEEADAQRRVADRALQDDLELLRGLGGLPVQLVDRCQRRPSRRVEPAVDALLQPRAERGEQQRAQRRRRDRRQHRSAGQEQPGRKVRRGEDREYDARENAWVAVDASSRSTSNRSGRRTAMPITAGIAA